MSGFQSAITVKLALDRISRKEFMLPAFQREFVWSTSQIINLFDSLMKGYPFGSMLVWKVKSVDDKKHKFYSLVKSFIQRHHTSEQAESVGNRNDFNAIMDGQQRLTALNIGFRGSYAEKAHYARKDDRNAYPTKTLYLNVTQGINDNGNYDFKFISIDETKEQDVFKDDFGHNWIKVGCVEQWKIGIDDWKGIELEDEKKMIFSLKEILNASSINYYEIEDENYEEAVKIFIRINSGGTSLSYSDIMFSMIIAAWDSKNGGKDARSEFDNLIREVSNSGFNINNDFILKCILVLFHKKVQYDLSSLHNEFLLEIKNKWSSIYCSISILFRLLQGFGLSGVNITSYLSTIPVLYYLHHKGYQNFDTGISYTNDREIIRKWLLKMLCLKVFGGSSDNILNQVRQVFTYDIEEAYFTENFKQFPSASILKKLGSRINIDDDTINELIETQKDNQYAFSILALLYPHLDYRNNNFHKDHLYPEKLYKADPSRFKYDWKTYNSIVNLQMLDANENMSKQDKQLKEWINAEVGYDTNTYLYQDFLKHHLIPNIDLELKNFDEFIGERRRLLIAKLKDILKINAEI